MPAVHFLNEVSHKAREWSPEEIEFYKLMFYVLIGGIVVKYVPVLISSVFLKLFNLVGYCYKKLFKKKIKENNEERRKIDE